MNYPAFLEDHEWPEEPANFESWSFGEPKQTERPRFILERFSEISFDTKEEWLVKRLLPRRGVAALYGQSESLKSFLAYDLSCHVAAGMMWAGQSVTQSPVVYIAAEGATGIRKRKVGFQIAHPDFPSEVACYLIAGAPSLGMQEGDLAALIASISEAGVAPGLIVIDTLAQTLGSGDENGAGMSQFISNANELARHFGAMVLVVHHVGLSDDQRLRGHSSLRGALDAQILCERVKGSLSTTLTLKKLKDEASERSWTAHMVRVVIGQDSEGEDVSTLVVETIAEGEGKISSREPRDIPAPLRMLMDVVTLALEENGQDFKPFGPRGPSVRATTERSIRVRYSARLAEQAEQGEDPEKLADRVRKSFKRGVASAINSNRLMAAEQDKDRLIWLP